MLPQSAQIPNMTRRSILRYIQDFITEHEYPPTVREIMYGLDISSTSVVMYHLKRLEKEGVIERTPRQARSIVVKEEVASECP